MDGINKWLTLIANIGIVVGLILVAVQLNQAERYADAEQVNAEYAMNLSGVDASFSEALPEAWARARINAPDLTENEATLVFLYLSRRYQEQVLERIQADRGLSIYDPKLSARVFTTQLLGNETALRWWAMARESAGINFTPEFAKEVDVYLKQVGSKQRTLHLRQAQGMLKGPLPEFES